MDMREFCSITGFSNDLVGAVCRKEPGIDDTVRQTVQDKIDELQLKYTDSMAAEEYGSFAECMLNGAKSIYDTRDTTNFWWVAFSVQLARCLELLAKARLIRNGAIHLDVQNNPKFKDLFYLCEQKTYMLFEMREFSQLNKSNEDSQWDQDFNLYQHFNTLARVHSEDIIYELRYFNGREMLPYPELILEVVEYMFYKGIKRNYRHKA